MQQARSNRELWSASFLFSMLMRSLVSKFTTFGELLSPSADAKLPLHGAGVYPDRCFFKLKEQMTNEEILSVRSSAWIDFCSQTGFDIKHFEYFQIYIVQEKLNANPIQQLNIILDGLELSTRIKNSKPLRLSEYWKESGFFQNLYTQGYGDDPILPPVKIIYNSGSSAVFKRFKSVPEISTTELEKRFPKRYWDALGIQYVKTSNGEINYEQLENAHNDVIAEDDVIATLKNEFQEEFRFRHKYFAIVQADGDNIGSLIREIEAQNGNILDFSDVLNDFIKVAANEITNFGAFPIYMGGDDLLFFAPVSNSEYEIGSVVFDQFNEEEKPNREINGNNIFFLLTRLNNLFKSKLDPIVKQFMKLKPVSLSFGVSFGYYKKPMNEIHEESYNLLFHGAKLQTEKDYISLRLEKHSGQTFEFGFNQGSKLYYHFLKLCSESTDKKENFLNSVMFKINIQQKLIVEIASDFEKLTHFFNENFNEAKHKGYKNFFTEVSHIIFETFKWFDYEMPKVGDQEDKRINRVYSTLRFIQFLNAPDSHE